MFLDRQLRINKTSIPTQAVLQDNDACKGNRSTSPTLTVASLEFVLSAWIGSKAKRKSQPVAQGKIINMSDAKHSLNIDW